MQWAPFPLLSCQISRCALSLWSGRNGGPSLPLEGGTQPSPLLTVSEHSPGEAWIPSFLLGLGQIGNFTATDWPDRQNTATDLARQVSS